MCEGEGGSVAGNRGVRCGGRSRRVGRGRGVGCGGEGVGCCY